MSSYSQQIKLLHKQLGMGVPIDAFVQILDPKKIGLESRDQFYSPITFSFHVAGPIYDPRGSVRMGVPVHGNPNWVKDLKARVGHMVGLPSGQTPLIKTVDGRNIEDINAEELPHVGRLRLYSSETGERILAKTLPEIPVEYNLQKEASIREWFTLTVEKKLPALLAKEMAGRQMHEIYQALKPAKIDALVQGSVKDWTEFARVHNRQSPLRLSETEAATIAANVTSAILSNVQKVIQAAAVPISQHISLVETRKLADAPQLAKHLEETVDPNIGDPIKFFTKLVERAICTEPVRRAVQQAIYVGKCRWNDDEEVRRSEPLTRTKSASPEFKSKDSFLAAHPEIAEYDIDLAVRYANDLKGGRVTVAKIVKELGVLRAVKLLNAQLIGDEMQEKAELMAQGIRLGLYFTSDMTVQEMQAALDKRIAARSARWSNRFAKAELVGGPMTQEERYAFNILILIAFELGATFSTGGDPSLQDIVDGLRAREKKFRASKKKTELPPAPAPAEKGSEAEKKEKAAKDATAELEKKDKEAAAAAAAAAKAQKEKEEADRKEADARQKAADAKARALAAENERQRLAAEKQRKDAEDVRLKAEREAKEKAEAEAKAIRDAKRKQEEAEKAEKEAREAAAAAAAAKKKTPPAEKRIPDVKEALAQAGDYDKLSPNGQKQFRELIEAISNKDGENVYNILEGLFLLEPLTSGERLTIMEWISAVTGIKWKNYRKLTVPLKGGGETEVDLFTLMKDAYSGEIWARVPSALKDLILDLQNAVEEHFQNPSFDIGKFLPKKLAFSAPEPQELTSGSPLPSGIDGTTASLRRFADEASKAAFLKDVPKTAKTVIKANWNTSKPVEERVKNIAGKATRVLLATYGYAYVNQDGKTFTALTGSPSGVLVQDQSNDLVLVANHEEKIMGRKWDGSLIQSEMSATFHPFNALVHHTIEPAAGAYPTFYNVRHTKTDMSKDASFAFDTAETMRVYHTMMGLPQCPKGVAATQIGCGVCKKDTEEKEEEDMRAEIVGRSAASAIPPRPPLRYVGAKEDETEEQLGRTADIPTRLPLRYVGREADIPARPPLRYVERSSPIGREAAEMRSRLAPVRGRAPPIIPMGAAIPPGMPSVTFDDI